MSKFTITIPDDGPGCAYDAWTVLTTLFPQVRHDCMQMTEYDTVTHMRLGIVVERHEG